MVADPKRGNQPDQDYWSRESRLTDRIVSLANGAVRDSGLTRAEVAARLGKSEGFVARYLDARNPFSLTAVLAILDAIDCRLDVVVESINRETATEDGHADGT